MRFDQRALARGRDLARPANLDRARAAQRGTEATAPTWYQFRNEAGSDTTTIYIYDVIDSWGGYWGVSAQAFIAELMSVTTPNIELRVNSPGGEVFEAVAIFSVLESHPATVTAIVDSLAASAASFLILAADTVKMHRNAQLMIHDAHGIAIGNAAVMDEMRGILDKISDNIASIYAEKAGGTPEQWRATMRGENGADGVWYSATEALDLGLVDSILGQDENPATDPPPDDVPVPAPAEDAAGTRVTAQSGGSDTGNQTPEQAGDTPDTPPAPAPTSPPPDSGQTEPGAGSPDGPEPDGEEFELPDDLDLVALIQSCFAPAPVPNTEGAAQ